MICNNIQSYDEYKSLLDSLIITLSNAPKNSIVEAMIANEVENNENYSFLELLFTDAGKKEVIGLASKLIYVPEMSDRFETVGGGGDIVLYKKNTFTNDILAIITLIVSCFLIYISFVRFEQFYNAYKSAALDVQLPDGIIDSKVTYVLQYFVSLVPGCNKIGETNFQKRVLNVLLEGLKRQVYDSLSSTSIKAHEMCFTQLSNDPTSTVQLIANAAQIAFSDSKSCVVNVMTSDFNIFVQNLTMKFNVSFGQANGAINMLLFSCGSSLAALSYLKKRIRGNSDILAIQDADSTPSILAIQDADSTLTTTGGRKRRSKKNKKRKNRTRGNRRAKK